MSKPRVVIIGGGFGGLTATQALRRAPVDIVLIDRTNHHLFQPLLYQVATAALSSGDIASPLRTILRSQLNVRVVMSDVLTIDRAKRVVTLAHQTLAFDYLIVSPGTQPSYFGHDQWETHAPGLKTLPDALRVRERILLSFEQAERFIGMPEARPYLTFCVVGGGATGVELAGALAEITLKSVLPDFHALRANEIQILLLEAGTRILPSFHHDLSTKAQRLLEELGVQVRLNTSVTEVTDRGVYVGGAFIETVNVIWAPGNIASPLLRSLQVPVNRQGQVMVEPDLSIPGDPSIFVIGDAAFCLDTECHPLPALAPVAMQQGRYVAGLIQDQVPGKDRRPFRFLDRGTMATIGKAKAVAQIGRFRTAGLFAWLLWSLVHIFFLIGFRNRFRVMSEWIWYYLTFRPGARLIHSRLPDDQ
ncbi:MAG: NAD(P)/FAD-dependent oxidoreductase [Nitrospiraceae bacterium]